MRILLIIFIFVFTGCAPKAILRKDVTNEQLSKDNGECKLESQKATQFDLSGSLYIQSVKQNQAYENCLLAKGYTYQEELRPTQKQIDTRYVEAIKKFQQNSAPIQDYIINVCRPMEDKEYVNCLIGRRSELVKISIFPDITSSIFNEAKEYDALLIRKEISRKEYKEQVGKLFEKEQLRIKEKGEIDIKNGIYTGNPIY